jgi:hypothetical protein
VAELDDCRPTIEAEGTPAMNAAQRKAAARRELELLTDHCIMLLRESPDPLPSGLAAEMQRRYDERNRPYFDDPQEYVAYCGECFARCLIPFGPEDVDQLRALNAAYPDECRRYFRYPASWLKANGLPAWFYDKPETLSERSKQKFLNTIADDRTWARATVVLYRESVRA